MEGILGEVEGDQQEWVRLQVLIQTFLGGGSESEKVTSQQGLQTPHHLQ